MSIIGIILFSSCLLAVGFAANNPNVHMGVGWTIMASLYGLVFAIVVLVKSHLSNKPVPVTEQLLRLRELWERGVITEGQFMQKKTQVLLTEQLLKLRELRERGDITEDQFMQKKTQILSEL